MNHTFSRRHLLRLAGAGTGALALAACGSNPADRVVSANATGSIGCVRTPEQEEGPYFLGAAPERIDITQGRPGSLLELNFTILDSSNCLPLGSAQVELWHADAAGIYSGFAGQNGEDTTGQDFLRGSQTSDGNGTVRFTTIYPGWEPGRTTHLHLKVSFLDEPRQTTQLYFPDDITNTVYTSHEAYLDRGVKDTTNAGDPLDADLAALRMEVIEANTGHFASHTIGIDR